MTELFRRPMQTLALHMRDNIAVPQPEGSPIRRGFNVTRTPPRRSTSPEAGSRSRRSTPHLNSPHTPQSGIHCAHLPRLERRPPNVPPSDDEKLNILESSRVQVLSAPDPELQLNWAQDVLNYVDISLEHERRTSADPLATSPTSNIEQKLHMDAKNIVLWLAGRRTHMLQMPTNSAYQVSHERPATPPCGLRQRPMVRVRKGWVHIRQERSVSVV